jgi:hypothetical protein
MNEKKKTCLGPLPAELNEKEIFFGQIMCGVVALSTAANCDRFCALLAELNACLAHTFYHVFSILSSASRSSQSRRPRIICLVH